MEPTVGNPAPVQSPARLPRFRRRRWLIVAFVLVLVLVSLCSWWYWPRGDARFVGTWQWKVDSDSKVSVSSVRLYSNGSALIPGKRSQHWSIWRTNGSHFNIGIPKPPIASDWFYQAADLVNRHSGRRKIMVGPGVNHLVDSVTNDEIKMTREVDGARVTLTRIPE
jgi:hypothetical protein